MAVLLGEYPPVGRRFGNLKYRPRMLDKLTGEGA